MAQHPTSLQLRYLQTLTEFASDRTSTVVFPVPIDTLEYFVGRLHGQRAEDGATVREPCAGTGTALSATPGPQAIPRWCPAARRGRSGVDSPAAG